MPCVTKSHNLSKAFPQAKEKVFQKDAHTLFLQETHANTYLTATTRMCIRRHEHISVTAKANRQLWLHRDCITN